MATVLDPMNPMGGAGAVVANAPLPGARMAPSDAVGPTQQPTVGTDAPPPSMSNAVPSYIPRRSPEDAVDYVTVSDPVIHADGMNKYTSYRVDCRPDPQENPSSTTTTDIFLQNNPGQYSSVLRRYSDFLWLYERLHKERAGAIVPPLPEKQAVARFSPEFVEDRRRALEKFLRRVVLHPELWDSTCLVAFLRADDVSFQHAKNTSKAEDNAKQNVSNLGGDGSGMMMGTGGGSSGMMMGGAGAFNIAPKNAAGIKKWFSEAKTTFSGDLVSSPDDDLFDEIERYVEALNVQMKRVSNQAAGLTRKSREVANGLFEFGLAFHQLGQSEGEELGTKLQLMGGTADTLSGMAATRADAELRRLEEPFKDYLKTVHAVKLALGRRHDKRVSYTALLHEIQTREVSLHRARMTPGSEGRAYSTEMSLQRYQAAANVAQEEYAECSQRVLREVDRFKREKAEEMKVVVLDFITLQIEVERAMEKVWGELVPKLEEGGDVQGGVQEQQYQQMQMQPTMANIPPSSSQQPSPAMMMNPSSSRPTYSNVPAAAAPAADQSMSSSIQYRPDLPGMGL
eukprot:CAMPEP_0181115478 /NCGR_PEP_ID=MMETSP1071-20121207/21452_1 /TAXON_ID=35127 /ORGANISM="Thalassiosira sp., Strain NH16" /LENGTH=567 /DNA_ID=CAMNT_0023199685 /DNA_START=78 /DNA_END=1781 /DNA_ORIENTATION=+